MNEQTPTTEKIPVEPIAIEIMEQAVIYHQSHCDYYNDLWQALPCPFGVIYEIKGERVRLLEREHLKEDEAELHRQWAQTMFCFHRDKLEFFKKELLTVIPKQTQQ